MSTIHQKFTGDVSQLEKEIEKLRKDFIKLHEQIAKGPKDAAKHYNMLDSTIQKTAVSMRNSITGMAGGYLTVQNALKLITAEMEHQRKLADEARTANISLADAQAGMIRNMGPGATRAQVDEMVRSVKDISGRSGVSERDLSIAAGKVLSGTGGDAKLTAKILGDASKILGDKPDEMAEFASRVPGVMTAMGTDDPQKAMAWMTAVMGAARLVKPESFGKYSKAISSGAVTQKGVSEEAATSSTGAILAGIGTRLDDAEGALTAGAALRLANTLENVVGGTLTNVERIHKVQADPKLQAKAMKLFGTENDAYPLVRELLTDPTSPTARFIDEALPKLKASKEDFRNLQGNLRFGTDALKIADADRKANSAIVNYETSQGVAFDAQIRSMLDSVLDKTASAVGKQQGMFTYDTSYGTAIQRARVAIETQEGNIRFAQQYPGKDGRATYNRDAPDSVLSAERKEMIALLDKMLIAMETLSQSSKATADNTTKMATVPASAQNNRQHAPGGEQ